MAGTVLNAERDAAKLLQGWWKNADQDHPLPVDPTALAFGLGIMVESVFLPSDVSGTIDIPADGVPIISLNRSDSTSRQRFTCAHEIGHYLRREATGRRGLNYTDYRDTLAGLGYDTEEVYSNQFAAALLMPAHLVWRWCETKSVEEMARQFGTSTQAMDLRLRNLRLA